MSRTAASLLALALVPVGVLTLAPAAEAASKISTRTSCSSFSGRVVDSGRLRLRSGALSRSTYVVKANSKYRYCVGVHNATPGKGSIVLAFRYKDQCHGHRWFTSSHNFGHVSSGAITFYAGFERNIGVAQVVYASTTASHSTPVSPPGVYGCV